MLEQVGNRPELVRGGLVNDGLDEPLCGRPNGVLGLASAGAVRGKAFRSAGLSEGGDEPARVVERRQRECDHQPHTRGD